LKQLKQKGEWIMLRIENYHLALQKCTECGAKFPVVYQFHERAIAPFGFGCTHVQHQGATFVPDENQLTFKEWYNDQIRARSLLANHA